MIDLTKNYLFIFAHPDDESFYTGGTIAKIIQSGGQAHIVSLTHGERGNKHCGLGVETLRIKRKQEFTEACSLLGATSFRLGNFQDSNVSYESTGEVKTYLDTIISALQPDEIITFGHEPHYPHKDHLATARHVTDLYGGQFPIWYVIQPPENSASLLRLRSCRKKTPSCYTEHLEASFERRETLSITLDDHYLNAKYRALGAHQSQQPASFIKTLMQLPLRDEWFSQLP